LALVASTHILIPIQTHFKAFQGTNTLIQTIAEVRKKGNPTLEILGIIPTLYGNTGQDKSTYEAIQHDLARLKIFPPIPRATAFADAAEMRVPLALFKPRHPAVKILEEIALGVKDG
jgi:chromosome partitioning protein